MISMWGLEADLSSTKSKHEELIDEAEELERQAAIHKQGTCHYGDPIHINMEKEANEKRQLAQLLKSKLKS